MEVSRASDVVVPVRTVELKHMRTKAGPVRVQCEAVDEVIVLKVRRALPGLHPPKSGVEEVKDELLGETPKPTRSVEEALDDAIENAETLKRMAPPLIEAGTALLGDGGEWVRPAFYFDEATPRHPQSIPGRLLRVDDIEALVTAILQCGDFGAVEGDAPESGGFPDGDGVGADGGVGTPSAGEVGRADGVGVPAR